MSTAAVETWHVVCGSPPARPPAHPHVTWAESAPGTPVFQTALEVAPGPATAVVTVAARLVEAGPVLAYASALARATGGKVLADPPAPWAVREAGGGAASLDQTWASLCAAAERDASAPHASEPWTPSAEDDWSDVDKG